jgi:hypothetical protein
LPDVLAEDRDVHQLDRDHAPFASKTARFVVRGRGAYLAEWKLMVQRPGLAELLEPAPDIEFGPTVVASRRDLDEPDPPSIRTDSQLVTPLAFPLAPREEEVDLVTRLRRTTEKSLAELREAWASTSDVLDETVPAARLGPVVVPFRLLVWYRRLRALCAFWDWQRDDLLRGAFIGGFVLVIVLGIASAQEPTNASGADEVRAPRTLDQHTGLDRTIRARDAKSRR